MISGFAEAFAAIRDEIKTRITQKVHAASVIIPEDDIAQVQNVILWMTIDSELQEMLLLTALEPADWEYLEPDLPKIAQVFHEELAFAQAALRRLKDETVRRGLVDERRRQRPEGCTMNLTRRKGIRDSLASARVSSGSATRLPRRTRWMKRPKRPHPAAVAAHASGCQTRPPPDHARAGDRKLVAESAG
jgi:hypothetical protein